ncbi:unnamed protein product [Rotaria magnacalcarata]|uniref:Uncharacterized protein n=1 Tax=Rotaria magnacalcarata TaxID=392030 RepID=A0A816X7P9_9BILA|nr:unnamed protein product [Rotaria magnacalcarata]
MSRRSSMMEDKLISEMILKNIATVSQMNVDMDDILNIQQMKLLTTYKQIYNYAPCLSFFLSLGILSHFAQGSYYTHYASWDHRPVQLYLWLLGSSATFQQTTVVSGGDEQTQTQYDRSAMFTVWNLIADLIEIQDLKPNEQQQILDFYAKAGAIFPRIACLMQLYFNAAEIFERLKHKVIFVEGDSQDLVVNENFVSSVANIIKIDYHVYDNSYLPYMEINQVAMDPIVIVKKEAVIAAWKWKSPDSQSNASKFEFIKVLQENVNIGYEEYIQSFYPQQNENVFTYNNWTLSDEFINIVKSNSFYTQHVRWSIQRFRPCDVVDDEPNSPNDVETLTAQIAVLNESTETTENNNHHETSQRKAVASKSDEEEEDEKEEAEKEDAALVKSIIAHQKRKAQVSENVNESETCRRTKRRMRK